MKAFSSYHPIVLLLYFIAVIGFTMFFLHPLYLAVSFIQAIILAEVLSGSKVLYKSLFFSIPLFLVIVLTNPLFTHDGLTVILFINDKPITLEAVLYGIAIATMIIAVIYWFQALNLILTSDKIIYLFGRIIPSIALIISMILRLIPKSKQQITKIRNAQTTMGMDMKTGSILQRIKSGMRTISILITWMLENGVDTADSMRARGYGLRGRTTYSPFKFQKRDGIMVCVISLLSIIIILGSINQINSFHYYPLVKQVDTSIHALCCYLAFLLLSALPIIIQMKEEIKWHYFQSKI